MKVVFLPAAERDLDVLFSYIKNDLQNPIAANNTVTKILKRSQSLAAFPEMGASLEGLDHRLDSYRYLLADSYLAIYKVTESQVGIVRILYARSDHVQLLQG